MRGWWWTMAPAGAAMMALAAPAAAQGIRDFGDGQFEVRYPGVCSLTYNRFGNRTYANPNCSRYEREQADRMAQAHVGDRYGQYPQTYSSRGWGDLDVQRIGNGGWIANFRNGCIVTYDRYGNRTNDTRPCNSAMRDHADREVRARMGYGYQGDYGYGRGQVGYSTRRGYGGAEATWIARGRIEARINGYDCRYHYNASGNHVATLGRQCSSKLRDRANEAQRNLRRYRDRY